MRKTTMNLEDKNNHRFYTKCRRAKKSNKAYCNCDDCKNKLSTKLRKKMELKTERKRKDRRLSKMKKARGRFTILEVAQPKQNWVDNPQVVAEFEAILDEFNCELEWVEYDSFIDGF